MDLYSLCLTSHIQWLFRAGALQRQICICDPIPHKNIVWFFWGSCRTSASRDFCRSSLLATKDYRESEHQSSQHKKHELYEAAGEPQALGLRGFVDESICLYILFPVQAEGIVGEILTSSLQCLNRWALQLQELHTLALCLTQIHMHTPPSRGREERKGCPQKYMRHTGRRDKERASRRGSGWRPEHWISSSCFLH